MLHRITLPALALGFLLSASAWGQHHHMGVDPKDYDDGGGRGGDTNPPTGCNGVQAKIVITGTSFSPSTVTVDPGQPVCWTWSQSAQHNVHGDDDSFTSGAPAVNGTFQTTFTAPGSHGFYCQVHGSISGGMRGTVVVRDTGNGGGGSGPGTIGLAPTAYTVNEAAGVVTVTVERAGGSDGKASVKFGTAPGSAKSNKDFTTRKGTLNWDSGDASPKTIEVPIKKDSAAEPDETFAVKLSKATGAALGAASATVTIHEDAPGCGAAVAQSGIRAGGSDDGLTGPCDETRAICLNGGRFEATVQWRPSQGDRSSRRVALPEAPNTGLFASSPEEEPQVLLHVLDRCAVNGHYWLDLAALTDLEFTVKVRDTQTGRTRVYFNPAGNTPATVRDVEAFATCP